MERRECNKGGDTLGVIIIHDYLLSLQMHLKSDFSWWQGSHWTKRVKTYGWYGKEAQTFSYYFTNEIKLEAAGNIHDDPELINL